MSVLRIAFPIGSTTGTLKRLDITDTRSPASDTLAWTVSETVHYRTCPFCEATCGLEVTMRGDEVVSVRGDDDDVFRHGFLCPKSQGLKQLHEDPDRLTRPLVRRDGELVEASWDEAFAEVDRGLGRCSPRAAATPSPSTSATRPPTASARRSTARRC